MGPKQIDEDSVKKDVEEEEKLRREKDLVSDEPGIVGAEITVEMEKSYIDYAMSVIVQRALPAVEDGLKPVHRRILYAMHSIGLDSSKPTKKSAAVVGEVLGKYHPHGDASVYDAMVRMAQDFSLRYPLVHGQGNFGSMDGDKAAAMRYTEAKLSKISSDLLSDIEKNTVPMFPNFDNSVKEPETLPGKLPNLLLNGATGIAVGMATNIPPHNLSELCDAIVEYINKPKISVEELGEIVTGPDFPTGGVISGTGIKEMYSTGKGRIIMRAKHKTEEKKGKKSIIITEIPYMVNKSDLVTDIAKLVTEKKLTDISDLRDESAKGKVRIVIELKRGVSSKFTVNKLYKLTRLQSNFDANLLALVRGQPRVLNLKEIIVEYVKYRQIVITKRSKFELKKAEDRLEIVMGLLKALNNIDKIVDFIKNSKNSPEAHTGLMLKFKFTNRQAKAILDTKLSQLTNMETGKLNSENHKLEETIQFLNKLLCNEQEILGVIKKDVRELKKNYGDNRRSKVVKKFDEISEKDLIEKKDVVTLITHSGYIKRVDLKTYREQKRGGAGVSGANLKDENDFVKQLIPCSTHDYLLFFTTRGRVYWLKANDVPDGSRQSKGRSLANLFNLRDEEIVNISKVSSFDSGYLMFATKRGIVKKLPLKDLSKPRSTGVRIMNLPLDGSDSILSVRSIQDEQEVLMIMKKGNAVRFNSNDVRSMGRASYGVKGVELNKGDEVVALEPLEKGTTILTITEKGYGKRSSLEDYRKTARGGKGVINLKTSADKTGDVVGSRSVNDKDSVIVMTSKGVVIRIGMKDLRVMGRVTQGVKIVKLKEKDKVAGMVKVPREDEVVKN